MTKLISGQTLPAKITMPFLLIALLILTNVLNPKVNAENAGPYGAAMLKEVPPGYSRTLFDVKFPDDSNVQTKGGKLTGLLAADTASLTAISQRFSVVAVTPVFMVPKGELDRMRTRGEQMSGKTLPDLSTWMRYEIASGDDAEAFMNAMRAQDSVYSIEPAVLPPPMRALDSVDSLAPAALSLSPQAVTPDFTGEQGYLEPAPVGIDAYYSWGIPGGDGAGITIFDVEAYWNQTHEDLSKIHDLPLLINPGDSVIPYNNNDHGTAMAGIMIADENSYGVTGISKGASIGLAPIRTALLYSPANAINLATTAAVPGDVILLELATYICGLPARGPIEWVNPVYAAIKTATANGIVVVEAAGNDNVDLDQPACGSTFDRNVQDSGAIIVGAGGTGASNLQRLDYSVYGSRLDVQGWGENVMTTGYGNYYKNPGDPSNRDYYYSKTGGTSSASPIVAGAIANLQGIAKNQTGEPLTPFAMRTLLVQTGTPQLPDESKKIGPRPNLALAVPQITTNLSCFSSAIGFESGIPAAFTTSAVGNVYWTTTDDNTGCSGDNWSATNETPATGEAACADADGLNNGGGAYDASLVTNSFDLLGFTTASLNFAAAYDDFAPADKFEVDISTNGGGSWSNELSWNEDHYSPGENITLDLSAYTGQADVRVRFRYYGDTWDRWAEVDDIVLNCGPGPATNTPPAISHPSNRTHTAGTNIMVSIFAFDPDINTLTFGASGLPTGLTINSQTGLITGTASTLGTYNVTVTVDDNAGGSDSASFTWIINAPLTDSNLNLGKHIGEDSDITRADETIGTIIIEQGSGTINGFEYRAGTGADTIVGFGSQSSYTLSPALSGANIAIVNLSAMDEDDGGWAVPYGTTPLTDTQLNLVIDEDQIGDSERAHTTEQVAYLVLAATATPGVNGPKLIAGYLTNVGSSWQKMTLPQSYNEMIVLASIQYSSGQQPAVTRIRNASGNSFEIRAQNPHATDPDASLSGYMVQLIVVEAGVYTMAEHGVKMEAKHVTPTITDHKGSWVGTPYAYAQSYTNPVVLGQVMTYNDPDWSAFWSHGATIFDPPSPNEITDDWGDLPDSFDTTTAEGGPSHVIGDDLYLGSCIDADADGQPDPNGGGDDNDGSSPAAGICQYAVGDDDDGLTLVTPLIPGHEACLWVDAVNSGANATLYGWIDFNGDDDFDNDTNEALVFNNGNTVASGGASGQQACFTVPADATFDGGDTHFRFRLTRDTLTAGDWGGLANDGEVEDYYGLLSCVSNLVWHDANGDGVQGVPGLEPGVDGVDVNLVFAGPDDDLSTPGDNSTFSTITAGGGLYTFCGLVSAQGRKYQVQIPTPPTGLPLATQVGQGTSFTDSDGDQPGGVNTAVFGPAFTVPPGGSLLPTGENGRGDALPNNFPDEQEDSSIDFGFYTPPGNMSNVQISHNNADIFLTWDPVPGAQVYDVWQSADEPYLTPAADCESDTSCTAVTQNAFIDNDILGSAPFAVYYTIIPRNSGGTAISPPSASVGAFSFAIETGNT